MSKSHLKIAVIGAGFSGTSVTVVLNHLSNIPLKITLFDKTGCFGVGDAYLTPFPFHLLNVRAKDMSAFEDQPTNFVDWLSVNQNQFNFVSRGLILQQPLSEQFVPRLLYRRYLKSLLENIQADKEIKLNFEPFAVVEATPKGKQGVLTLSDGRQATFDKVVLALGNNPPNKLPFSVSKDVQCISNPWDYAAPAHIEKHAPVLIVGTGLSMIDAVLTLHHHQHQGKIYAVSRHGLLPLAHTEHMEAASIPAPLPKELRALTTYLRSISKQHIDQGGDWRALITAIRAEIPIFWRQMSLRDKKCFLRHLVTYWNIHRHRVHWLLADLLAELVLRQQLKILAGRVLGVENKIANVKLRHSNEIFSAEVHYVINCMGPSQSMTASDQPLISSLLHRGVATLDPLNLGFAVGANGALKTATGEESTLFYALGASRKGEVWEISAVPEIRQQSFNLARHLLSIA